jgi:hypothetical protein
VPGKRTLTESLPAHAGPVQRKVGATAPSPEAASVHEAAQRGVAGSSQALPHLDQIQASFGRHSVSGVAAHVGGPATEANEQIGASAYAVGNAVAFASAPDLHTAAHEAAHVVQQRAGVHLKGGVGEAGDAYEQHADAVADLVVQGKSSESLLDRMTGGGAAQGVQRKAVKTDWGEFRTDKFQAADDRGVEITLKFDPDETKVDAKQMGMTQTLKAEAGGQYIAIDPSASKRMVGSGGAKGSYHDTLTDSDNPLYGSPNLGAGKALKDTPADNNATSSPTQLGVNANYELGYCYKDGVTPKKKEAGMWDKPQSKKAEGYAKTFETTVLAVEGTQKDKYYGSVKWGYKIDASGIHPSDIELASKGDPTANFVEAAKLWNAAKTRGTLEVVADPATVLKGDASGTETLAKGTKLQQKSTVDWGGPAVLGEVLAANGTATGKTVYIKNVDVKDAGDGRDTKDLPIP